MTEEVKTPPGAEGTPAPAKVATPPAVPAAIAAPGTAEPEFLRDRLDRERRSVLKDLGIKLKRGEDPQERIEEYKAELDSDRAENKGLKQKVSEHEATIEKLAANAAAVKVFADMEFNALNDAQKAIVIASAGDDPNERLKTIAIMKASAPPPVSAAPIPAPAQTAPAQSAPAPTSSQPVDVKQEHARLLTTNPLMAAAYLLANRASYYPDK